MHLSVKRLSTSATLLVLSVFTVIHCGCNKKTETSGSPAFDPLMNANPTVETRIVPIGYSEVAENLLARPLKEIVRSTGPSMMPGASSKLFKRVAKNEIKFSNFLSPDKPFKLIETGSGVAIGDYDNDGLPDIYFVGSDVANKLYKNMGNLKFVDVTESAGVNGLINNRPAWGSGATFADIDNDGDLDLFVCNMAAPNLMYVNQGDGTFLEQSIARGIDYRGASKVGSFCDYDRDGDLDFYLVTYQDFKPDNQVKLVDVNGKKEVAPEQREYFCLINGKPDYAGEEDILYRNRGDGTFENVTEAAGVSGYDRGLACVWMDHDNDGWPDIYVGADFKNPDKLYRNNRDGTFSNVIEDCLRHTPWFSMGLDAGDLNNDGLDDLMTTDMAATTHYKQKVGMGAMDDSAAFLAYGKPRQYMKNVLNINSGVGPYFEAASLTGMSNTDWTWSVRFADVNNNGRLDVLVTNGHARQSFNSDVDLKLRKLKSEGASKTEYEELYKGIPPLRETNLAFENKGGLEFDSVGKSWGFDHNGVSHGLAMSDLDNDGDLDVVINNYFEKSIVYQNQSKTGSRAIFEFRCDSNNRFGFGTKVEVWQADNYQSKTLFPTRGYLSTDEPVLHFGFPNEEKISRVKVTWPDGTAQEFADLESGSRYRVFESETRQTSDAAKPERTLFVDATDKSKLEFKHTENEFDDFEREPLLPYQLSRLGGGVSIGDVNGDGQPDVYSGGAGGQAGQLLVATSNGFQTVEGPWEADSASEDMGALFFDADNDGDEDLYVVSGGTECDANDPRLADRLYLNTTKDNQVAFERANEALPSLTDSGSSVCAADIDRDGDLDLFVGSRSVPGKYPVIPSSRLLINEAGKFSVYSGSEADQLTNIGLVNSALWSDIDNDGWQDLLIAAEWGPVQIFRNEKGTLHHSTSEFGIEQYKGWWHGITAADLDEDGDLDYVVTNHGHNTKYHADKKHPHRLYFHDFDNSGTLDLVETKFEGNKELPVRGRSCSSHAMPFIKDKFKTYESFALASLTDIYEPEICDRNAREVNFLDSAIFWNVDGTFQVESLPHLAQISPGFGIQARDFDCDGVLDLMIANNFFPNQVETGFMDGGLGWFMKGRPQNGTVKFDPVWPHKSGVVLDQDNKGLAVADIDQDGDLDVLVQENNGRLRNLENKTSDKLNNDSWIRISLQPKTNQSAIGTAIKLTGKNDIRRLEVQAGGSYLSQSAASDAVLLNAADLEKFKKISVAWPDGSQNEYEIAILERANKNLAICRQGVEDRNPNQPAE